MVEKLKLTLAERAIDAFKDAAEEFGLSTETMISEYLKWSFEISAEEPSPDDTLVLVFEELGEPLDFERYGNVAESIATVEVAISEALQSHLQPASRAIGQPCEQILSQFLNALVGLQGTPEFETLIALSASMGRIAPIPSVQLN
jgi:hypothetical protein